MINKKTAEEVTRRIKELIIDKHGSPDSIMSDNGLEFTNSSIQALCKQFNIKWILNSPGHHQTMGCVERVNQTLMNKLRKLCNNGHTLWEDKIEEAIFAVNISFH